MSRPLWDEPTRAEVFARLWTNGRYLLAHARKDALGAAWNRADAHKRPEARALQRRFRRACRRIDKLENEALLAAGFRF